MSLFDSGIRPAIDAYLEQKAQEVRDYGDYWSASSAGYCMRKLIFERLGVPHIEKEGDARKHRVFEAGHIFHSWIQGITKAAELSVAQELELLDDELMIKGHCDDLIVIDGRLMLYDYKTQHSGAFTWQKGRPASYFHRMQVGTYMHIIRKLQAEPVKLAELDDLPLVEEARILKISKDDLRMDENRIVWTDELAGEVLDYWTTLNKFWADKKLPPCSCADHENGFMAKEAYNPYFYAGEPCSLELYKQWKAEQ